jgi:hypothetical protein
MKPAHALVLVAAVAIAAVAGTYAALRTTQLSAASGQPAKVDAAAIARQNRALDRVEAALRRQLARKTPALPRVPKAFSGRRLRGAAPPTAVVYVRPKAIVRVIHRHGGGDDEHDGSDGGTGARLDD